MSMQNFGNGPGPLPKRWLHCPRKSENIIAERFVAFKTPLNSLFNDKVPPEHRFTPDMILGYVSYLKCKLGLWIDLTNTNRFYDRKSIEDRGITYIKLQCVGHGATPTIEQTRAFIEIVDNFINDRPLDLIGVHCTHGFNRTGFLIISYLVERLDCSLEGALAMFSQARPPGIYKQDYIDELFRRYDDIADTIRAPELPEWCFKEDAEDDHSNQMMEQRNLKRSHEDNESGSDGNDEDGDGGGDDDEGNSNTSNGKAKKKKRHRVMFVSDAKFMTDIKDISLVTDQKLIAEIQTQVREMCNWNMSTFPGCQPVSLDPVHLKKLQEMPYRVSWKADGTRYMMFIKDRNQVYFIDRNFSLFKVDNLTFLKASNLNEHLTDTLLDGEMVLDKIGNTITPRYLVYDIVKLNGKDVGKLNFPSRLACVQEQVVEPRKKAIEAGLIKRHKEAFGVHKKDFWHITEAHALLDEKFTKKLPHEPDGLIFQPSQQPYVAGTCDDVLKWKPSDMNSIDFRLKIELETGQGILERKVGFLYVEGKKEPFATMKYTKNLKDYHNKIIECYLNLQQRQWVFMRERTDKVLANSIKTAESVLYSILHPVTKDDLLKFIKYNGYREIMPPPTTSQVHRSHHQQQSQHAHYQSGHQQQYPGSQQHSQNSLHQRQFPNQPQQHPSHQQQQGQHSHYQPSSQSGHHQHYPGGAPQSQNPQKLLSNQPPPHSTHQQQGQHSNYQSRHHQQYPGAPHSQNPQKQLPNQHQAQHSLYQSGHHQQYSDAQHSQNQLHPKQLANQPQQYQPHHQQQGQHSHYQPSPQSGHQQQYSAGASHSQNHQNSLHREQYPQQVHLQQNMQYPQYHKEAQQQQHTQNPNLYQDQTEQDPQDEHDSSSTPPYNDQQQTESEEEQQETDDTDDNDDTY